MPSSSAEPNDEFSRSPNGNDNDNEDAAQWTRVIRKGKALGRQVQVLRLPLGGPESNFPPNPNARLTLDDIRSDHAKMPNRWRTSAASKALDKLVADNCEAHAPITTAVCLGLGSFDPEDGSFDATRRSHVQLEAFLAIVKVLRMDPSSSSALTMYLILC